MSWCRIKIRENGCPSVVDGAAYITTAFPPPTLPLAPRGRSGLGAKIGGVEGAGDRFEGPSLSPSEENFALWRPRNAGRMGREGWSGLYWARRTEGEP
jgi:hypothetical protein